MEFENNDIIYKNIEGLEFIQFRKLLEFGILNAYTLNCENIDFSFKDNIGFDKLCKSFNIKMENILVPKQSHTDTIKCVDRILDDSELNDVDGLITDKKDIVLATRNADCILFLFYDPIKKVIANVHSGWRGTFKKIALKTVLKMQTNYNCSPDDIYCFISPCIRKCHFEVDSDVKDLCKEIFSFKTKNLDDYAKNIELKNSKNSDLVISDLVITKGREVSGLQKYNIDTVLINKILLEDFGLKKENIIDSNICSMCNKDKINSSRAQGKNFKRAISIISL